MQRNKQKITQNPTAYQNEGFYGFRLLKTQETWIIVNILFCNLHFKLNYVMSSFQCQCTSAKLFLSTSFYANHRAICGTLMYLYSYLWKFLKIKLLFVICK